MIQMNTKMPSEEYSPNPLFFILVNNSN